MSELPALPLLLKFSLFSDVKFEPARRNNLRCRVIWKLRLHAYHSRT